VSADLDERDDRDDARDRRALLERFPRSEWRRGDSSEAAFWLEIHDGFRHGCATLGELGDDYRGGRLTAAGLAARAAPMLRGFIVHLSGHHRIEDDHYFPAFRSAEPRLARRFDALAADHETLQHDIDTTLAALDALTAAVRHETSGAAAAQAAAERYGRDSAVLFDRLCRHLSDEENLVVPLLLARGA
jgi:hypothetical protein